MSNFVSSWGQYDNPRYLSDGFIRVGDYLPDSPNANDILLVGTPREYRYEVCLYRAADKEQEMLFKAGLTESYYTFTPKELFLADITNVIANYPDIEDNSLELTDADKYNIIDKIGGTEFYWTVRSKDGLEASDWADFATYVPSDTYRIRINIKGMVLSPGAYHQIRCLSYLSNSKNSQPMFFSWDWSANAPLEKERNSKVVIEKMIETLTEQKKRLNVKGASSTNILLDW